MKLTTDKATLISATGGGLTPDNRPQGNCERSEQCRAQRDVATGVGDASRLQQQTAEAEAADAQRLHAQRLHYIRLLREHDWHYQAADDPAVYRRGREEAVTLERARRKLDPDWTIWRRYAPPEAWS